MLLVHDFVHSKSSTKKITLFLELEKILHLKPPLNLDSCNIIVGNNFSIQDDPHMWGPYPSIILKTYEVKRLLCTTHTRAKSSKMFGMELKTLIIRHLFWWYRKVHRLFLILRKIQQLTLIIWKYMIKLMAKLNKQCHFAVWCVFSREREIKKSFKSEVGRGQENRCYYI